MVTNGVVQTLTANEVASNASRTGIHMHGNVEAAHENELRLAVPSCHGRAKICCTPNSD